MSTKIDIWDFFLNVVYFNLPLLKNSKVNKFKIWDSNLIENHVD